MAVVGCRSSMHTAGASYATHALISRGWSGALVPAARGFGWTLGDPALGDPDAAVSLLPQRLEGGGPPGTCTNGLRVQEWPASESAGVARTERVRHPDPRGAAREDDVGFGGPG